MRRRSCTIVLVGSNTANRKWINYEIIESWKNNMGIVGIYIHGLKNSRGNTSSLGYNPFYYIEYGNAKLSNIVKCYEPQGLYTKSKYEWISKYLNSMVEEALFSFQSIKGISK